MGLRQQLEACLQGRVCFLGLGNGDYGDDGFGVQLGEALRRRGVPDVYTAEANPERIVSKIAAAGFDEVVLLDAVELGVQPGSAILLSSAEMIARYPQVSTHKMSLGTLAKLIETNDATRTWLLGVQPESLQPIPQLTATVRKTLELLTDLVGGVRRHEIETNLAGVGDR